MNRTRRHRGIAGLVSIEVGTASSPPHQASLSKRYLRTLDALADHDKAKLGLRRSLLCRLLDYPFWNGLRDQVHIAQFVEHIEKCLIARLVGGETHSPAL